MKRFKLVFSVLIFNRTMVTFGQTATFDNGIGLRKNIRKPKQVPELLSMSPIRGLTKPRIEH